MTATAQASTKVCPTCQAEYGGGEVFCPVDATRLQSTSQADTAAAFPEDPLVGTTLGGRYRILGRVGEGGMGIVYEAEHVIIEKRVALKVLRDDFSKKQDVVERFRQEAKSASRIGHEHIVEIYDFGETPSGQSYFVMEYLQGEDLANVLAREGTVEPSRAVRIAAQCCKALGAAHAKGIVHRDMKPENIFLVHRDDEPDFVKIVDFGIAKMSDLDASGEGRKLTKTGMIFGTPEYMSPEQAQGKALDHRVDTYAMGIILYEMLTGRTPFVGDSFMGILTQHMFEPPPPMHEVNPNVRVSEPLEAVIAKALSKDPNERFQSMTEMLQALRSVPEWATEVSGEGPLVPEEPSQAVALPSPTAWSTDAHLPPASSAPSRGLLLAGAALGVLGLAGLGAWWVSGSRHDETPKPPSLSATGSPASPSSSPRAKAPPPAEPMEGEPASQRSEPPPAEATGAESPRGVSKEEPTEHLVQLTVDTRPSGAAVTLDSGEEVCSVTPCVFDTPAGKPLVLLAVKGRLKGRMEVRPLRSTRVEIPMRRPGRRRGTKRSQKTQQGHRSSVSTADLKPVDLFELQP